ncbi:hypothetical protein AXF42_Ash014251 [Apostasia shenzhenica]|uniref:SOSEKI DIX-like domain-containing protein n=1 Tax=Apostasia shenzhenica TaxID=1088818 RepID=A0A2I0A1D7_9ASPA|nr:hypothetical protein AXF42_Ash014251 [Apostasia shenzhenica]
MNYKQRSEKQGREKPVTLPADAKMEAGRVIGEVGRIHIVYFLCRNGKIEQPHLIRLHHLHRNGVRLRDVKRWLSELRGKEMADSFSWSYKRRYKAGYVWQDLTDDDLITAISDNEYVLKGSLLPSLRSETEEDFLDKEEEDNGILLKTPTHDTLKIEDSSSPKPPPQTDEDSPAAPDSSTTSSEETAGRKDAVFKTDSWKEELKRSVIVKKKGSMVSRSSSNGSSDRPSGGRRRPTSDVLRNLLRCKTVDTNESVVKRTQNNGARKAAERTASSKYKAAFEPNCSKTEVDFQNMEKEDNGKLRKTPAHERLKIDDIISPKPPRPAPPAAADRKAAGFMNDSWKEEVKRLEIVKKSGIKASRSSSNGSNDRSGRGCRRRTTDAVRNLLRCKTVDTNETAVTAAENRGARKAAFEPNCS